MKADKRIISAATGLVFFVPALLLDKIWGIFPAYLTLYALAWAAAAWPVAVKAWRNIRRGTIFDENFLMLVASMGAFAINLVFSDFETELCAPGGGEAMMDGVLVMLLYQVGEYFQALAVRRSRRNIRKLLSMRPDSAVVLRGGKETEVDPDEVEIGETTIVRAGERIAIDGIVTDGASYVDTSMITGESVPAYVKAGDEVKSGCIAVDGLLTVRTTKAFGESTATKMLRLVEEAADKKAKQETFITSFAKVYTPIVCGAALIVAVIPALIQTLALSVPAGQAWHQWIYTALSLLVVSCPCALVISVPLTFFSGIGGASKLGVLVKGSDCFSPFARSEIIAFDKTGTITSGKFSVTENAADERALAMLAAAESKFNHPIAKAFDRIDTNGSVCTQAEDVSGKGIRAVVDGSDLIAGTSAFMKESGIECKDVSSPYTVVHVAINGEYKGYVTVADTVKPDSVNAMAECRREGIRTIMLTGDRPAVAAAVAAEVGTDEYRAGMLPQDKVDAVLELKRGGKVIFCGDGINDAPVLAAADAGCAMGGVGSDSAIEAADIVVMHDDLTSVIAGRRHAKKVIRIAMENIIGSLAIKIAIMLLSVILPALGVLTEFPLWVAIMGDVGVCLVAIANSMRALYAKKPASAAPQAQPSAA